MDYARNKMKIICDPFLKRIRYQWYANGAYEDVGMESELAQEKFTSATLQNKASEIVEIIHETYDPGNVGLTIYFAGTEDDYEDLCSVIGTDYTELDIKCEKDDCFFNNASDVMPQIQEKFSEISETLGEYSEKEIMELISKYDDTVKPAIYICVMGLYSSGKSSFINGLIGEELLPSDSDPYTARVCKIHSGKNHTIEFQFDGEKCKLGFRGNQYAVNNNCEKKIINKLQEIIKTDGMHSEIAHMNKALGILNEYKGEGEHTIGDYVDIEIPFRNTRLSMEEFDFIIIDTPGSNSESHKEHFQVLESLLDEQTNALPVFVVDVESMDASDLKKLMDEIKAVGMSFDTTNAITIVNKCDRVTVDDLEEKKEKSQELTATKGISTVCDVSSVIGIASKKQDPYGKENWFDGTLFKSFKNNVEDFGREGDMCLYKYKIGGKNKENLPELPDLAMTADILYRNSGFESVEQEIVAYAQKYSLYHKCRLASEYLQKAIDLCLENVRETDIKLKKALEEVNGCFNEKSQELVRQLEGEEEKIKSYNTAFQKMMRETLSKFKTDRKWDKDNIYLTDIYENFSKEWKRLKEQAKKEKKEQNFYFTQMESHVRGKYNGLLNEFSLQINEKIDSFWSEKSQEFKDGCGKIISGSEALSEEQKQILNSVMLGQAHMSVSWMDFNLRKEGVIKNKTFLFFKRKSEEVRVKHCCGAVLTSFDKTVSERIHGTETRNSYAFRRWADGLIATLTKELCTFNPELHGYEEEITRLEKELEKKHACEKMLRESKEFIDGLLEMQGGYDE